MHYDFVESKSLKEKEKLTKYFFRAKSKLNISYFLCYKFFLLHYIAYNE